jgi:hypothetical protein
MNNPAAALAAMRKKVTVDCEVCGEKVTGLKGQVRYCSNKCRQKAYRERSERQPPEQR